LTAFASPVTLKAPVDTVVGNFSLSIVSGDFNGDGKLDTATANYLGNNVSVLLGDGKGNFAAPVPYAVGIQPRQIISGQFNGDAFLDLATVNRGDGTITVLLNNGTGVFTPTSYTGGGTSLTAGDFNGDGRIDFVTTNESTNIMSVILANAGGGYNTPALTEFAGATQKYVTCGLLNADGFLDLVIANSATSNISILSGDGAGHFSAPVNIAVQASSAPYNVSIGDFDGDTKVDLIVNQSQNNKMAFLKGDGAGNFVLTTSFTLGSQDATIYSDLRDVNADGKLDILVVCFNSHLLRVLYGDGAGGIASQNEVVIGKSSRWLSTGDFNGDGKIDIATVSDVNGSVSLSLNKGTEFPSAKKFGTGIVLPRFADFNNDGKQDMYVNGVRLGNGDGTFAAVTTVAGSNTGTDLIFGDVNNDGKLDIIKSGGSGVSVVLNNGSGAFPTSIDFATTAGKLALGDFDGDGKADLVVGNRIYQGNGLGSFSLAATFSPASSIDSIQTADFNNDGKLDLVEYSSSGGGSVKLQLWNGTNSFAAATNVTNPSCTLIGVPSIVDFNYDGKLDMVGVGNCGGIAIFRGEASGNFNYGGSFAVTAANSVQALDFDRDGHFDVGFAISGKYGIAYGNGAGQFTLTYNPIALGTSAAAADVTSDGVPDVAFTCSGTSPDITGTWFMYGRLAARGKTTADFDGDGLTDISVFRPSTGTWYIIRSSDNSFYSIQFGQNGDVPVPGDYDADGKTDLAVFRPSGGVWYIVRSADGSFVGQQFGAGGDTPVPADYDGDGATNVAVFRPSNGYWYYLSGPNFNAIQFGAAGDIPTQADFDGDGFADLAVFRPSNGVWYSQRTSQGFQQTSFGINGDRPAPLDFDGDGKANIAVFRPSTATWYTSTNPATNFGAIQWGVPTDVMAPGYYDGDGKADVGVFRTGTWYVLNTATPTYSQYSFGAVGDIPIPLAYIPQ
jgi:hypothetical protein